MLPIVIPIQQAKDNIELRYTLRSIETYYGPAEITLIGDKPHWIKGINHLPFKQDPTQCRNKNVMEKLLLAANTLNSDFIRWSDDIFALSPITSIPFYSQGTMMEASIKCGIKNTFFRLCINNTMRRTGPTAPFFDVHTPCPIHHESFKEFCSTTDWSGYKTHVLRSYYYNWIKAIPEPFIDLKLIDPIYDNIIGNFRKRTTKEVDVISLACKERLYVSLGDDALTGNIRKWINDLFPLKSQWEQ